MANTYQQNGPFGASDSYVRYSISPDLGQTVAAGETVTVQGTLFESSFAPRSLELCAAVGEQFSSMDDVLCTIPVSISKGKAGGFSMSFQIPAQSKIWPSGARIAKDALPYFRWYSGDRVNSSYTYLRDKSQTLTLLRYRLEPRILAMDFERCDGSGAWADDGLYFRCKTLNIAKNSQAAASEITTAQIVCAGSDGSSRTFNLTSAQLNAALDSGGYSESAPGVFSGFTSALGVTYTLTLTLSDGCDAASFVDTVVRAFARMHLSGARNGGLAVGMFSSATDEAPKFEVAESHESFFYGGVSGVTNYVEGESPTGGHWIDGAPIYRFVCQFTDSRTGFIASLYNLPVTPKLVIRIYGTMRHETGSDKGNTFLLGLGVNSDAQYDVNVAYRVSGGAPCISGNIGTKHNVSKLYTVILEYTKN